MAGVDTSFSTSGPSVDLAGAGSSASVIGLQPAAELRSEGRLEVSMPATPPTPFEIHDAVVAEQGLTTQGSERITEVTDDDSDAPDAAGPSRPPSRSKLSRKLFLKGRDRASSLSKLPFVRPGLARRSATNTSTTQSTTPTDTENGLLYNTGTTEPRRKPLARLQDRFARSAPSSPAQTPSASTDRVHLFRSRPSSIVLSGRGIEFNYFTGHPSNLSESQPSSCNASEYQPALDKIGNWGSAEELAVSEPTDVFEDALPRNVFDAVLPREVKLKVFSLVVESCIEEVETATKERSWSAARAARERWVGERGGLRELVKMSRVCREWRDLVFDGQLWQNVHISKTLGCDTFLADGLVRLARHAGSFLRRLDLRGFAQLQDIDLESITESCVSQSGVTSLSYIDLSG